MLAIRTDPSTLQLRPFAERPVRASIGATRNPESTRAILEAAEAILREKGLAGLSMDEIARRARCGKPTLYKWWPNKSVLLAQIHDRSFEQAARIPASSLEDLSRFWIKAWHTTLAGPALCGMLAEAQSSAAASQVLNEQGLEPYRQGIAAIIGPEPEPVEAALREWLPPLIGELMLGLPSQQARRPRQAVMRMVKQPDAEMPSESNDSTGTEENAIRHRGEWVD